MAQRKRSRRPSRATARRPRLRRRRRFALAAILVLPLAYFAAALAGSLIPVNRGWVEPDEGITVYIADNGIHADLVLPVRAGGLDWRHFLPPTAVPAGARWLAFGSGEERVYLDTPRWRDIKPATIWSALTGGNRVMHVHWSADRAHADRAIRLRPEEYRRLFAAIRSDFQRGPGGDALAIDHPGYGCCDSFYRATGRFNALKTCNSWAADRLRIAGIETSLWPPFVEGLVWRYRKTS